MDVFSIKTIILCVIPEKNVLLGLLLLIFVTKVASSCTWDKSFYIRYDIAPVYHIIYTKNKLIKSHLCIKVLVERVYLKNVFSCDIPENVGL